MTRTVTVVLVALACVHGQALACSCVDEDFVVRRFKKEGLSAQGPDVFYGRVVNWRNPKEVEVRPLEVFRGKDGTRVLRGTPGIGEVCGGHFSPNEEFVYFPDDRGFISLCSKFAATQQLLQALRTASRRPIK